MKKIIFLFVLIFLLFIPAKMFAVINGSIEVVINWHGAEHGDQPPDNPYFTGTYTHNYYGLESVWIDANGNEHRPDYAIITGPNNGMACTQEGDIHFGTGFWSPSPNDGISPATESLTPQGLDGDQLYLGVPSTSSDPNKDVWKIWYQLVAAPPCNIPFCNGIGWVDVCPTEPTKNCCFTTQYSPEPYNCGYADETCTPNDTSDGGSVTIQIPSGASNVMISVDGGTPQLLTAGNSRTIDLTPYYAGERSDATLPGTNVLTIKAEEIECLTDADCPPNPNEWVIGGCDWKGGPGGNLWYFQTEKGVCDVDGKCKDMHRDLDCGKDEWVNPAKYQCLGAYIVTRLKIKRSCYNDGCYEPYYFSVGGETVSDCNGGGVYIDDDGEEQFYPIDGPCSEIPAKCSDPTPCYCPGGCSTNNVWEKVDECSHASPPTGNKRCTTGMIEKEVEYKRCLTFSNNTDYYCASRLGWLTDYYCGIGGCTDTGATRCGGAVGVYPASIERESQCAQCVSDGDNAVCNRWIKWGVGPLDLCWEWGSSAIYCVGKDMWQLKVFCKGGCSVCYPFGAVCTLGNPTADPCRQECDTSLTNFYTCQCGCTGYIRTCFPTVCGPGISCTEWAPGFQVQCTNGATQACGKCGTQSCSNCTWGQCQNEGVCTPGETKSCACGGTQTCNGQCQWDPCQNHKECQGVECKCVGTPGYDSCKDNNDCNTQTQHKECITQKCVLVPGAGNNLCQQDTDCANKRRKCDPTNKCVQVAESGPDQCLSDNGCPAPDPTTQHKECIDRKCVLVPGAGNNLCQQDTDCANKRRVCLGNTCIQVAEDGRDLCLCDSDCGPPPDEENPPYIEDNNLEVLEPENYCIGIPGMGQVSIEWIYQDLDSNVQTRFDLQVSSSPFPTSDECPLCEVNRTSTGLSNPVGFTNTQTVYVLTNDDSPGGEYLTYNKFYYARVRVWDSTGLNSGWVYYGANGDDEPDFFTKANHPYPFPNFTYSPSNPAPEEEVQFIDSSICYDNSKNPYPCKDINPITGTHNEYTWIFGDTNSNNDVGDTSHSYNSIRLYPVNLIVCDDIGCCQVTKDVPVGTAGPSRAPEWREISPF